MSNAFDGLRNLLLHGAVSSNVKPLTKQGLTDLINNAVRWQDEPASEAGEGIMIKIEAVSNVIELQPGKRYLLIFQGVTPEDAEQVLNVLRVCGVDAVSVGLLDGESVQIVEVPTEAIPMEGTVDEQGQESPGEITDQDAPASD